MDPYKILGTFPHASSKEVKEAYENLVQTYNSDEVEDESVKALYLEKLNEANEAYRLITLNIACQEVRDLIENDDFITAESKLNLTQDESSAEWNYLMGVLMLKKGWVESGVNHIKKASNLNPYNNEYINTMKTLNQNVKTQRNNVNMQQRNNQGLCNNGGNNGNKNGLC